MTSTIKGQTKAAAAIKDNFGIYEPILHKLCMQVAYWPPLMISGVGLVGGDKRVAWYCRIQPRGAGASGGGPEGPGGSNYVYLFFCTKNQNKIFLVKIIPPRPL